MSPQTARLAGNFLLFQCAWFAAVLLPSPWDALAAAAVLAVHFRFIAGRGEWRLLLAVTVLGAAMDSALAFAGVFQFGSGVAVAPPWLLGLWVNFAATFRHSLAWLLSRPALAAVGGAVSGPFAYWGGTLLTDKLSITVAPLEFVLIHAPLWAALMFIFVKINGRLSGR